jgi:hypothetical protein
MHAVIIFPHTKFIRVILAILVKWVLHFDKKNIEKNKSKVCFYNKNLEKKPILDKTLFKKDLQNEEEGLYKIHIKEVFGKFH